MTYRRQFRPRLFSGPRGWVLVIIIFSFVAWLAAALDQPGSELAGAAYAVDGDTLRMGDERMRLLGIDAPERDQSCTSKNGKAWACGEVARERLAELIMGEAVTCAGNRRDLYDRALVTCKVHGKDIGAVLVSEGLALGEDEYLAEQISARNHHVGIWAGDFMTPRAWRDQQSGNAKNDDIFDWVFSLLP